MEEKEDQMKGVNWVPGIATVQSAYRSELSGIVGILVTVAIIVKQFGTVGGGMTIASDEESALD